MRQIRLNEDKRIVMYKKSAGRSVYMVAVRQNTAKADLALNYSKLSLRKEQISRDWYDFCSEDESWLISQFHLLQHLRLMLCNISEPALIRPTKWSCATFCACPDFISVLNCYDSERDKWPVYYVSSYNELWHVVCHHQHSSRTQQISL